MWSCRRQSYADWGTMSIADTSAQVSKLIYSRVVLKLSGESLQGPDGGFRGGLWDTGCDVEYTFYGIGVLALLAGL